MIGSINKNKPDAAVKLAASAAVAIAAAALFMIALSLVGSDGVSAATDIDDGDFTYALSDAEPWVATVKKYNGSQASVDVPSQITYDGKTYAVTAIGIHAFKENTVLESVAIPGSVTSIGEHAFHGCASLASVTIPNSVTSLEEGTFCGCASLASVTIPGSVTSIGNGAFSDCASLASVTIPGSVTSIGNEVFCGCASLASVHLPGSVTSIGNGAFSGCMSLASVTIPDSVETIEKEAFKSCTSLASVFIHDSVTSIGNTAFAYCTSLTSVRIPNSVETIEEGAFYGCESLASVTIPGSVTSIEKWTFLGCTALTSVSIPGSVETIKRSAFSGCTSLAHVAIPDSVNAVDNLAFGGCVSLVSVTMPSSVTIGNETFKNCPNLSTVIVTLGGGKEQNPNFFSSYFGDPWRLGVYGPSPKTLVVDASEKISLVGLSAQYLKTVSFTSRAAVGQVDYPGFWKNELDAYQVTDLPGKNFAKYDHKWRDFGNHNAILDAYGGVSEGNIFFTCPPSIETLPGAYREGYTLKGWYTLRTGGDRAAAPYIPPASTILCAQWTENSYGIAFDPDGGIGDMAPINDVPYASPTALPANAFKRDGYDFVGWRMDGLSPLYVDGATVSGLSPANGATVTLHAVWEASPVPEPGPADAESDNTMLYLALAAIAAVLALAGVFLYLRARGDRSEGVRKP